MAKRVVSALLIATILLGLCAVGTSLAETLNNGWIMFVYTENGGSLNVRSSMSTSNNSNIIGHLPYGAVVQVFNYYSGWAMINYNNTNAYVMSRYLVYNQPVGPATPTPVVPTPAPAPADNSLAAINKEFKSAVQVKVPYVVISRPSRASGWVNLRWAPSTSAERITTCSQGKELIVMAELKTWYQVQDPDTGMVGFISRNFVVRK